MVDDTSTGALILERVGSLLVSLFTTPFIAAVTTLVYFDLRVRKEGFDLALLAERMGGASAYDPAPASATRSGTRSRPAPIDAAARAVLLRRPPSAAPTGAWAPPVAPGAPTRPRSPAAASQPPPPVPDE